MEDYKLRDLRASHTFVVTYVFSFSSLFPTSFLFFEFVFERGHMLARVAMGQGVLAAASAFHHVGSGVIITRIGLHHPHASCMTRRSHGLRVAKREDAGGLLNTRPSPYAAPFNVLDKDGDNRLSRKEWEAGFDLFDMDGDGFITRVEFNGSIDTFMLLDADGDGRITRKEYNDGFDLLDKDGSGFVTVEANIVKKKQTAVSGFLKTGVGAFAIFGIERALWAAFATLGWKLPTATVGMLLVMTTMLVLDRVSPKAAFDVTEWFNGARTFYSKGVPLFFSPPLVQLPITLSVLSITSIIKFFAVIFTGVAVSITTTALGTNFLIDKTNIDTEVKIVSKGATSSGRKLEWIGPYNKPVNPWKSPVLLAAAAGMCVFAALRIDMLIIACASVAALQFGKALPAAVRAVCPAVITCAGLTAVVVSFLGSLRGVEMMAALAAHKTSLGGFFGGTGVGDFLFLGAGPAIVALGFNLFEQRSLLQRSLIPIVGGSCLTAAGSVIFTALLTHALHCEPVVGLSLVTRFVTLPMAVPFVDQIHSSLGLAAAAVVIQVRTVSKRRRQ